FRAEAAPVEGITRIDSVDFAAAQRFGFTIKHLAVAEELGDSLSLRTHPALIPKGSVLSNIDGVLNCVFVRGRGFGPCFWVGPGPGAWPSAMRDDADLANVACVRIEGHRGLWTRGIHFGTRKMQAKDDLTRRYYLRFEVSDAPGVL